MAFDQQVDLITGGNLRKALFSIAIPAMFMMLGVMLFELVDMFWIGRTTEEGTAAVSAATYLIWAIKGLAGIAGGGINTLVSRSAGRKSWDRVVHWFWRGIILTTFLSIVFILAGFAILDPLLDFMMLSPVATEYAYGYLTYFYFSLPFVFLYVFFDNIFRSLGDAKTTSYITIFALSINAILDPLFIFGWSVFPELGVVGAAVASLIAHALGVLLYIWKLNKTTLAFRSKIIPTAFFADFWEIVRIGSPIALSGALFSIIYIFITRIVSIASKIGIEDPLAAFHAADIQISALGIGHRWESAAYYISMGMSYSVATLVGQNLGRNNIERAKASAYLATRYLVIFTIAVSLLFIFGGEFLAFILMPDPEVVAATAQYLFIVGFFEISMAFEFGLEGAFVGSGNTLPPFLISFPITAARIPIAYYFAIYLGLGINAVWWTIGLTMLIKGLFFALWFYRGNWTKVNVRA